METRCSFYSWRGLCFKVKHRWGPATRRFQGPPRSRCLTRGEREDVRIFGCLESTDRRIDGSKGAMSRCRLWSLARGWRSTPRLHLRHRERWAVNISIGIVVGRILAVRPPHPILREASQIWSRSAPISFASYRIPSPCDGRRSLNRSQSGFTPSAGQVTSPAKPSS